MKTVVIRMSGMDSEVFEEELWGFLYDLTQSNEGSLIGVSTLCVDSEGEREVLRIAQLDKSMERGG